MRERSTLDYSEGLRDLLENLYRTFDFKGHLLRDPLEFPHRYATKRDAEVVAFISSCFAYGRVEVFKPVIEAILERMGRSPYEFLLSFDPSSQLKRFSGVRYRFQQEEEIVIFLHSISRLLQKYGSLEALFMENYRGDVRPALEHLFRSLRRTAGQCIDLPGGLKQLLPLPSSGSACKRANLFLRWMVRDGDVDLGLWKGVSKASLIIPLDTHIARISRCLGLTGRSSVDWKTAEEITEVLKTYDPEDPLRYDFALCHQGISGLCKRCRTKDSRQISCLLESFSKLSI